MKIKSDMKNLALIAASFTSLLASVDATTISVNYAPSGNGDPNGSATAMDQVTWLASAAVGVVAATNWNQITTSGSTQTVPANTLFNSSGATTTMTVSTSMGFGWSDITNPANNTARLLNGSVGANDLGSISVGGISYAMYDVIMYFGTNSASTSARAGITSAGYAGPTNYFTLGGANISGSRDNFVLATGTTNATATSGANYARFNGLTSSSFTLTLADGGTGNPNLLFYGFQVVEVVPEPSAVLLGAFGVLALLRRRRA
jgi:hypothetical protein